MRNGIHFLVIDLFPPGPRDPQGIAQAIWDELVGESLGTRPADKLLTVAAYDAGNELTAYVDALALGDLLPDAPLFLAPGWYVNVPLEQTYMASWNLAPKPIRDPVAPSGNGGPGGGSKAKRRLEPPSCRPPARCRAAPSHQHDARTLRWCPSYASVTPPHPLHKVNRPPCRAKRLRRQHDRLETRCLEPPRGRESGCAGRSFRSTRFWRSWVSEIPGTMDLNPQRAEQPRAGRLDHTFPASTPTVGASEKKTSLQWRDRPVQRARLRMTLSDADQAADNHLSDRPTPLPLAFRCLNQGPSKHGPGEGWALAPSPRGRHRGCRRGAHRSCLLRDGRRPGSRSTRRRGAGGSTSGRRPSAASTAGGSRGCRFPAAGRWSRARPKPGAAATGRRTASRTPARTPRPANRRGVAAGSSGPGMRGSLQAAGRTGRFGVPIPGRAIGEIGRSRAEAGLNPGEPRFHSEHGLPPRARPCGTRNSKTWSRQSGPAKRGFLPRTWNTLGSC